MTLENAVGNDSFSTGHYQFPADAPKGAALCEVWVSIEDQRVLSVNAVPGGPVLPDAYREQVGQYYLARFVSPEDRRLCEQAWAQAVSYNQANLSFIVNDGTVEQQCVVYDRLGGVIRMRVYEHRVAVSDNEDIIDHHMIVFDRTLRDD